MKKKKKARLNLELDHKTKTLLDRLKIDTEASSLTDVIRRSLTLYHLITEHASTGGAVILRMGDHDREIIVLG